ncbi:NAD(P)-binding protein [Pilatotrama ljubarskyi]|nr:NAD(P)-binding protein [Pilatotrama ljubarskyi]
MSAKPTVTIVGGTGLLGHDFTSVFLAEYKAYFSEIRLVSRDPSSQKAQELIAKGAKPFKLDEANLGKALDEAFSGVDVIIDLLSHGYIHLETSHGLVEAAARSTAKVFFSSEWGGDYPESLFSGHEPPVFKLKRELAAKARSLMKDKKVIAVYTSGFLELVFRPGPFNWIKIPAEVIECIGPASQRLTFSSTTDIGRAAARLSVLALDPATASNVPDRVYIAGTTVSIENIRDLLTRYTSKKPEIKSEDLSAARARVRADPAKAHLLDYVRIASAEGKVDFSTRNDNELVNPGESLWKWKTVEDELREVTSQL